MYNKHFYASGFARILNAMLIAVFIFSSAASYNPRIVRAEEEATTTSNDNNEETTQITFCHVPPGNEGNPQTITTSMNAWINAHNSGTGEHSNDYLGECEGDEEDEEEDEDEDEEEDTGSITVCKIIQDTEGATVAGDAGSTFTVPAWLDESYEGEAVNPSESDSVFSTPLADLESIFGDVQGKCVTYDELELGRYYYGEEETSSGMTWEAPRYNDGATGAADNLSDLYEFNSGEDEANDDFDGVINISEENSSRTLLVLNKLADACPELEGAQNFGANCEPQEPTTTVTATKIVCDNETDLPNWGDNGPSVTATTATDFLETHPSCHLEPWTFEWIDVDGATPSGYDAEGHVEGWTTFSSGVVTSVPAGQRLWFREQMQDGYIPFSADTTNDPYDTVGAEFYCATDVLHYDNLEFIDTVEGGAYNCIGFNVPTEQSCEEIISEDVIVSDTTTEVGESQSSLLTFIHAAWTATISGASWIWSTDPVVLVPNANEIETFTKNFEIDGTPLGGSLMIAADNGYSVTLNGEDLCSDEGQYNYNSAGQDVCPISAEMLNSGENTITFTVTNMNLGGETTANNPAGLLYKLTLEKNACEPTPSQCNPELNLIENGDFEAPVVAGGDWDIIPDSNPFLKWLVDWVSPQESGTEGLEIQNNVAGSPYEGNQHAELDGDHPVKIWQDITTVEGETYDLSFAYSARPGRNSADNEITVKADGVVLGAVLANDGTANGNTVWGTQTRSFVATDTSTKIEFVDTGTDTSFGGYLDSMSLTCNPDPEPTDVCPNLEGNQSEVPEGMEIDEGGQCVDIITPPVYACSDNIDNSDEEDALADELDPACHTDGNVNNPGSYDPEGTSESNESNQCSDGLDNSDEEDGLIDSNDPGCHSDGDASNSESWVPSDNDESNDEEEVAPPSTGGGGGGSSSRSGSASNLGGQVLGVQAACGLTLDTYMRMNYHKNNPEKVKILQNFLNTYLKSGLVVDGKFGPITDRIVKSFQAKHADEILTPWKIGAPTGLVYKTTVRVINNIMCPELNLPVPTDLINWSENPALR